MGKGWGQRGAGEKGNLGGLRIEANAYVNNVEVTKKDLQELGIFASALGHVGDGNFHTGILYHKDDPDEYRRVKQCIKNMVDR